MPFTENLFRPTPESQSAEVFEALLNSQSGFRLERIVSHGQATQAGEWYDQNWSEWVILLKGAATLRFETDNQTVELRPGDYLEIPARCRHRVESTALDGETVWLALHFDPAS